MSKSIFAEPSIQPEDIVQALLDVTQNNKLPTDVSSITSYLGLTVQIFDNTDEINPRIRAFLWPSKKLIGIYHKLSPTQRKYSILHEVGHFVLPGHAHHPAIINDNGIIFDESKNLSSESVIKQEIEANQFAADCIFQLDRLDRQIQIAELSWRNILIAAHNYEASIEATARRWVERSTKECALVAFGPTKSKDRVGPLKVLYTIASKPFSDAYFSKVTPGQEMGPDTVVYKMFHRLDEREEYEQIVQVENPLGETTKFLMRLFDNTYRVFGLLTPL